MSGHLILDQAGPGLGIQDLGRQGGMGLGLSRGGAADRQAFLRGAALLGNPLDAAAIEMTVGGGRFTRPRARHGSAGTIHGIGAQRAHARDNTRIQRRIHAGRSRR